MGEDLQTAVAAPVRGEPLPIMVFSVVSSGVALASLLPLFVAVAAAIKLSSPGPVLYRQQRVGKGGKLFTLYKLRTMVEVAGQGVEVTGARDRRVTGVGRFLRKYKIDELPQLINVVRGDMSLVGPRPEVPRYVARYTPEQRRLLLVRPGITDPATLSFRDEAALLTGEDYEKQYLAEVLPRKLAMSLDYLARRTFFSDLKLILLTLWRLGR